MAADSISKHAADISSAYIFDQQNIRSAFCGGISVADKKKGMSRVIKRRPLTESEQQDAARLKEIYTRRKAELASEGAKLTQEELAARCGWSGQSTVSQFINGIVPLSLEALISLSRELNAAPEEISPTLAAKLGLSAKPTESFSNVEPATLGDHKVPVLSYVQAGAWAEPCEVRDLDGGIEYISTFEDVGPRTFAIWIKGRSMEPWFEEGDLIVCDPDITPHPGDYVIAKNGSEEATFKKYRPRGYKADGTEVFELVPLNEDYPTLSSETCPIRIVATMIEHRKFRKRR